MPDKSHVRFVTEVMTSRNPHLSEPDTEGEYADGKYKTEATADEGFTERFQAVIKSVKDKHFTGKNPIMLPWRETEDGAVAFVFRSPKKQPILTDAKGNPLSAGIVISDGSLIRITGVIAPWEAGLKRGLALWPDAVRVIRLGDGFDAAAAFGPAEDGFDVTKYAPWCGHTDCRFNRLQSR